MNDYVKAKKQWIQLYLGDTKENLKDLPQKFAYVP